MENVNLDDFLDKMSKNPPTKNHVKTGWDYLRSMNETFRKSLENGSSPFLPNEKGVVDLQPVYDLSSNHQALGKPFIKKDSNLSPEQYKEKFQFELQKDVLKNVLLLTKQKELNAPTPAFITFDKIQEAIDNGVECSIPKGTHGVVIPYFSKNPGELKTITYTDSKGAEKQKRFDTYFNISQIQGAENLLNYYNSNLASKVSPEFANKPMSIAKAGEISLSDKTNSSETYLMQVMSSIEEGKVLKVSKEQADNFVKTSINEITKLKNNGYADDFALKRICNNTATLYNNYRIQKNSMKKDVKKEITKTEERKKTRDFSYERSM